MEMTGNVILVALTQVTHCYSNYNCPMSNHPWKFCHLGTPSQRSRGPKFNHFKVRPKFHRSLLQLVSYQLNKKHTNDHIILWIRQG